MDSAVWHTVLGEIELTVSRATFATWFKNTHLLGYDQGNIQVGVPNVFAKHQLEVKFNQQITDILTRNGITFESVEYIIHSLPSNNPGTTKELADNNNTTLNSDLDTQKQSIVKPQQKTSHTLNRRYTFEEFIVGSGNDLAYTACQAIVKYPGIKYNPLFVYGGVGLGKTHLIQAVGNAILDKNPNMRVYYITTETFVNEFLDSIRFKKKSFSGKYRDADVLIIDDMQFITGKEKTQEEFFHTFNTLHQANKQIIISSDKPPKAIPTLTERLRSRFEWGMTVDIQQPDFETRVAILQTKAHASGITLPSDCVEYLATHIQTNIRELEGGLNQLLAYCEMRGIEPDLQIAMGLIENTRSRPRHVSAKQVIERTARHFQIDIADVLGPKRDKDIVLPRQIAMYLLRSELHLSFPKIAKELGRKDHTTAIHSVEKIEKNIKLDQTIRQYVNEIRDRIYA